MVVLDLLMAKSHHWRKPQFYPEDTNVSNEVFHTLEAETYIILLLLPDFIYNAKRTAYRF